VEGVVSGVQRLAAARRSVTKTLIGTEDDLWQRLNLGAQGVISALANFIPDEILQISRMVAEGDEAGGKALSEKLQRARAMTKEYASPAVLKRLAEARHGVPMGTVRPPFVPLPQDYDPEPVLSASLSAAGRERKRSSE
jgi:4-hydroxy-tetrahydrodipicolinate synthase